MCPQLRIPAPLFALLAAAAATLPVSVAAGPMPGRQVGAIISQPSSALAALCVSWGRSATDVLPLVQRHAFDPDLVPAGMPIILVNAAALPETVGDLLHHYVEAGGIVYLEGTPGWTTVLEGGSKRTGADSPLTLLFGRMAGIESGDQTPQTVRRWRVMREHSLVQGLPGVLEWQDTPGNTDAKGARVYPVARDDGTVLIEAEGLAEPQCLYALLTVKTLGKGDVIRDYAAGPLEDVVGKSGLSTLAANVVGMARARAEAAALADSPAMPQWQYPLIGAPAQPGLDARGTATYVGSLNKLIATALRQAKGGRIKLALAKQDDGQMATEVWLDLGDERWRRDDALPKYAFGVYARVLKGLAAGGKSFRLQTNAGAELVFMLQSEPDTMYLCWDPDDVPTIPKPPRRRRAR